jgi:predicted enzyme related to lactoylglutathione lyase
MGHPVVHFEVMGEDAEKLQAFYAQLFDWKIAKVPSNGEDTTYGLVEREVNSAGVGIGGGIGASPQIGGHVTFYVEVPDVEAALAKAESLGGTRLMGPDTIGPVELGIFNDPEGHMVGLTRPVA